LADNVAAVSTLRERAGTTTSSTTSSVLTEESWPKVDSVGAADTALFCGYKYSITIQYSIS